MADRHWNGGHGAWETDGNWTTPSGVSGAPQPGDDVFVAAGDPVLSDLGQDVPGTFDDQDVTLGDGTSLTCADVSVGSGFVVHTSGSASLVATGDVQFDGTVHIGGQASVLSLRGPVDGLGQLVLSSDSRVDVDAGTTAAITMEGSISFETEQHGTRVLQLNSDVENDGTARIVGCGVRIHGDLDGRGQWIVQDGGTLEVDQGVSVDQTIDFDGDGGELLVHDPAMFAGSIDDFHSGDFLTFAGFTAVSASYDEASRSLTLAAADGTSEVLSGLDAAPGALDVSDEDGNTTVSYSGSWTKAEARLSGPAIALGAHQVVSTLSVPSTGDPIDGSGIKVGIISDSFFARRGGDTPDDDATAGYLPQDADGRSAVQVLGDVASGTDEGRALAEVVHSIAPGAAIAFAAAGQSYASVVDAVHELEQQHCDIILDDVGPPDESPFSIQSPFDQAVSAAVASGIDYFAAAGNSGDMSYGQTFSPGDATAIDLEGGARTVTPNHFLNGTPYLEVSGVPGSQISVNWDAPWTGSEGGGAPNLLEAVLLDDAGDVIATSQQNTVDDTPTGIAVASLSLTVPTGGRHRLVVYSTTGDATGVPFEVSSAYSGFSILDAYVGSGAGTMSGHELIPGVNTVGAIDYGESPAFDTQPSYAEPFSSQGPGAISYGADGDSLDHPNDAKPDFVAPDGGSVPLDGFPPFFGTSAATAAAAGVAALMLQADPHLTTSRISALLEDSAIPLSHSPVQRQGAGLIRADAAVELALKAAEASIWTAEGDGASWSDAGNWLNDSVPDESASVTMTDGDGSLKGAYLAIDDLANCAVKSLTVDGGTSSMPTLVVGDGDILSTGSVELGMGAIDVAGTLLDAGDLAGGGVPGVISLETGGFASFGGVVATGEVINFAGERSTLALMTGDTTTLTDGLSGSITGLAAGDTIDLTKVAFDDVADLETSGSSVRLLDASDTVLAQLQVDAGPGLLGFTRDGGTGTEIGLYVAPILSGLMADVSGAPGASVRLAPEASLVDAALDGLNGGAGDYGGASLVVDDNDGAGLLDFSGDGQGLSASDGVLSFDGAAFGTYSTGGGSVTIAFTDSATIATSTLVDVVLRALTFEVPSGSVRSPATVTFSYQGAAGSAFKAAGETTVSVEAESIAPPPPTPAPTPAASDAIHFSPEIRFVAPGVVELHGSASASSGPMTVETTATVDGQERDLGTATWRDDGSFALLDEIGSSAQLGITATATDDAGKTISSTAPFTLRRVTGAYGVAVRQDSYALDGTSLAATATFAANGRRNVDLRAPDQTLLLQASDIVFNHDEAGSKFVFEPGAGLDVIRGFEVAGAGHGTLDLPASDFRDLADVLRNAGDVDGSTFITDPITGGAIRLAGVTTAELKVHGTQDVAFHARSV